MHTLRFLHRWLGGLLGLLLGVLALSGTLLLYKDVWLRVTVPHAADAQRNDVATVASAVERLVADPASRPSSIILATDGNGLHRLYHKGDGGAYTNQAGSLVTDWSSRWERWEVWMFDLHHYLLAGETGETVAGISALAGLGFVVTGVILWWRSRRNFRLPIWPRPMSRSNIIRHHRNLGTLLAPLLVLSLLTGAMMTLPPVAAFLLSPLSSREEMDAASGPPGVTGGPLSPALDWRSMLTAARDRFPDAELRVVGLPHKPGDLIRLRLRQPWEWLPNGRTTIWFDPADGRIVEARDPARLPAGSRAFGLVYPLHAAKVGGAVYKAVMTVTGLGLALLGSLAVYSFWLAKLANHQRARAA
ncbi:PepSY-associated TM helix domain-containing protein [Emcibacter sp. SYSU 3D8]|uniref:PepSY-associated TM helix domain-containing protein n=1 Tax=Emcibacter sp. SYSU 3D8 TaxID=3133969 RepID=UPI0031FE684C